MKRLFILIAKYSFFVTTSPVLFLYTVVVRKKHKKIVWGPVPMINYKYWSKAMKNSGHDSVTLVHDVYGIHERSDFDIYYESLVPGVLQINKQITRYLLGPVFAFMYVIRNASIVNIPFSGGYLGQTPLWALERLLYKLADIKVVVSAYGRDFYMYSRLLDQSLKHVLLMSYPEMALQESQIVKKVNYWSKQADAIINGIQLDGIGRWSCLPVNMITISNNKIYATRRKSDALPITIVHTPNHRGFKGTEFILNAIDELKQEGYSINFLLLEKIKNTEVLRILREEADILVEQIIFSGYAMSGIEGMANGLAVLSNLSNDTYTQLLRRYSYLDECPILSTNPENIKDNIRLLIDNPGLRQQLGGLGIRYVKKYHSEKTAQYMFGKIYNQLLHGVDEDLINMFHPMKSAYVQEDYIHTPLKNNCYKTPEK